MRDWLVGIFGEAYATAAFWTIILIAVAVVLIVFLRVNRRFTAGTFISGARGRQPRLAVTDATPVDNHRRLVLVRRDDVEHLILIGGPGDLVIETNIGGPRATTAEPVTQQVEEPAAPVEPRASGMQEPEIEREAPRTAPSSPEPEMPEPEPERRPSAPEPTIQIASRPAPAPAPRRYPAETVTEAPQPMREPVSSPAPRRAVTAASIGSLATVAPAAPIREPSIEDAGEHRPPEPGAGLQHTDETPAVDFEASRAEQSAAQNQAGEHTLEDEMSRLLEELSEQKH
ncbi:flagellar biosynthetic protein FliO [Nitratireductor sp. L1-7-SE]|uniref:Flagellar biosynthetic protein FliO n=1 Tax=Nitratireductor rhodophyticola TaxID=2854036 RepID=A0ABS7R3C8_9HYPH|nr:flagellar biosynthetic protein FliO [Nitratireductor rhodophyticola]MBY8915447.1 flagellar biosynthetic protein FliO [Nitratireductor rhodophyticola]MBY8919484.1 flagellar biosynthetic protein FliO [Nitratireductor rhodophyticola]